MYYLNGFGMAINYSFNNKTTHIVCKFITKKAVTTKNVQSIIYNKVYSFNVLLYIVCTYVVVIQVKCLILIFRIEFTIYYFTNINPQVDANTCIATKSLHKQTEW